MKKYKTILTLASMLIVTLSFAQPTVFYHYDDTGNRDERITIILKKTGPEQLKDTNYVAQIGDCKATIFPNPTKGVLRITLDGFNADMPSELSLYTMNGSVVKTISPAKANNELDLLNQPFGVYFLRITANTKTKEWKIVRE